MMLRYLAVLFFALTINRHATSLECATDKRATPTTPNVILYMLDDVGMLDLYSDKYCPFVTSRLCAIPNIKKLITAGVKFNRAYSTAPVCSPSRASILTGQHSARIGMNSAAGHYPYPNTNKTLYQQNPQPLSGLYLPQDVTRLAGTYETLAERFKVKGYKTTHFGKWHLGSGAPYRPQDQGFDSVFPPNATAEQPPYWEELKDELGSNYRGAYGYFYSQEFGGWKGIWKRSDTPLVNGKHPMDHFNSKTHIEDVISDKAVAYMDERRTDKCRYFMNYWSFGAHVPLQTKNDYYNSTPTSWTKSKREYWGMLKTLDDSIGKIYKNLRTDTEKRNTLFILTSDNGPIADPPTPMSRLMARTNAPLLGGKGEIFEAGVRIPFVVSQLGRITGTRIYNNLFSLTDVFATLDAATSGSIAPPADSISHFSHLPRVGITTTQVTPPRDKVLLHFPHGISPRFPSSALIKKNADGGYTKILRKYNCTNLAASNIDRYYSLGTNTFLEERLLTPTQAAPFSTTLQGDLNSQLTATGAGLPLCQLP